MPLRLRWVYLILIAEQVVASGTFIAAKRALVEFEPLTLAFVRFLIAAAGLFVIHLVWPGRRKIDRSDYGRFALLGLMAVVVNQGFFLYGLRFTTPTHSALLYGATPVFVFLLAIPLIGERPGFLKISGVLVTVIGVVVIVTGHKLSWADKEWLGDILILVAVLAWALYTVLGKPMVAKYGAVHVTAISLIVGTAFFAPVGLLNLGSFHPAAITARGWWSLLYIAIGTSVICYTIWFWGLGRLEATKVAVFNNLQPIVTAVLSYWLMGEELGARLIAGGVLVIFGVILTERG